MRVQTCAQNLCGTFNWFCLVSVLRGNQSKSNIAFGDSYLYHLRPLQRKYFQRDWIALSDMDKFQVIVCLFLFLNQQCYNSSCNITVVSVPAHIVAIPALYSSSGLLSLRYTWVFLGMFIDKKVQSPSLLFVILGIN